jgi:hypothetical protein
MLRMSLRCSVELLFLLQFGWCLNQAHSAELPPSPEFPEPVAVLEQMDIAILISSLGDDDFQNRVLAQEQLLTYSPDQLLLISSQQQDLDLESRMRLERITQLARKQQFLELIKKFDQGVSPEIDSQIPCWQDFCKRIPNGQQRRHEFATMVEHDPDLFLLRSQVQEWDAVLNTRCYEILAGVDTGVAYQARHASSFQSLLFLSTLPECRNNPNLGNVLNVLMSIHAGRLFQGPNKLTDFDRDLLNHFVVHATVIPETYRFEMGNRFDLEGTVALSREMIKTITDSTKLHDPICCLARLGDESQIPELVNLLKDERDAGPRYSPTVRNKPLGIQVRDVALACLLIKTHQEPKSYGFHHIRESSKRLIDRYSTTFNSEDARQQALEMWQQWAKEHLNDKHQLINVSEFKKHHYPSEPPAMSNPYAR